MNDFDDDNTPTVSDMQEEFNQLDDNFEIVKDFVNSIQNLYCVGRNGQHRYNNMDHSILTGFEAAKAYISGTDKRVVWNVNTENEYHEEKKEKN